MGILYLDRIRRRMLRIVIAVGLAALAPAEAESEPWNGPFSSSYYWPVKDHGDNWMNINNMNSFHYGKRSAEADADAFYESYTNPGFNFGTSESVQQPFNPTFNNPQQNQPFNSAFNDPQQNQLFKSTFNDPQQNQPFNPAFNDPQQNQPFNSAFN